MKYLVILLFSIGLFNGLKAQNLEFDDYALVKPYHLDITLHKTSILIFPTSIKSADRGDSYVLAEKVKGVGNMLKVKAAQKDFEPSNLHVITADGKVYTFNVNYSEAPERLTIDLNKQKPEAPVTFDGVSLNDKQIESYSGIIAAVEPFLKKGCFSKYGLKFYVQGIHIKNDVLFLSYRLKNSTQIKYDVASLRCYVRDKNKSRRTAVQDKEQVALYVLYKGRPEDDRGQTIVVAFPKFTIAEDKYFAAELTEL